MADQPGMSRNPNAPILPTSDFGTGPNPPVSVADYLPEQGGGMREPHELGYGDRMVLLNRVRADLAQAKSKKVTLNERARHYRRVLDLEPKSPAYQGAPTITLPLVRSKFDGVVAHLTDALDVEPFFSAKGETAEAMRVSPTWEALMEAELVKAESRSLYLGSTQEAAAVGTGIIGWDVGQEFESGEILIQETAPKFENVYAYPVAVDDFTNTTLFVHRRHPWFVLNRMAREGLLDRTQVNIIKKKGSNVDGTTVTTWEQRDQSSDTGNFSDEQRVHSVWECYVRWQGELFRVMFHEGLSDFLSDVKNPYRKSFDAPGYEPIRIIKRPGYLWGMSIPQLLDAIQAIMDNAENSRLSYNVFAMNPVVMADRLNPFLAELQKGGLLPNQVIPTMGPPDMNGIKILEFPKPDVTIEEMELAQRFADLATFTDFQMQGAPFAAGRRTATEVTTGFNIGTLKLRKMLRDARHDLARAAKKRWALTDTAKVAPAGVLRVHRDSKQYLLSSNGVSKDQLDQLWQRFTAATGGSPTPQARLQEVQNQLALGKALPGLVDGGIPAVRRDDIRWIPNGSDIIPDKVAELKKLDGFAPYMNWLPYAKQDRRIWYFLKTRLVLMGRADWQEFVGEDPQVLMEEQQYTDVMNQLMQQSSQLANNGTQGGSA